MHCHLKINVNFSFTDEVEGAQKIELLNGMVREWAVFTESVEGNSVSFKMGTGDQVDMAERFAQEQRERILIQRTQNFIEKSIGLAWAELTTWERIKAACTGAWNCERPQITTGILSGKDV